MFLAKESTISKSMLYITTASFETDRTNYQWHSLVIIVLFNKRITTFLSLQKPQIHLCHACEWSLSMSLTYCTEIEDIPLSLRIPEFREITDSSTRNFWIPESGLS